MSKLQELISRLCPDGVPSQKLISVANVMYGYPFNSKLFCEDETYIPLIRIRDVKPAKASTYYSGDYLEDYVIHKGDILVGMDGNFNLEKWNDRDALLNQRVCKIYSKDEQLVSNRFLYHLLGPIFKSIEDELHSGTVIHLSAARINKINIPIPPIEVQTEIAEILDRFADYAAELQAELQARKEQYEYYRNLLLTFNPSACGCGTDGAQDIAVTTWGGHSYVINWKPMGEVLTILRGKRLTKDKLSDEETYPVYHGGLEPLGRYTDFNRDEDTVMVINVGASAGTVGFCSQKFWSSDGCYCLSKTPILNSKFLYYLLSNNQKAFVSKVRYAGIPTLDSQVLKSYVIPIPPLELQEKIVGILDRFETLVNDLTQGLPAEIAAIKEQYEYYRNKLLTFKQAV